jgi:glycosyltransferase involved in cell wall biosynthesis
MSRTSSPAAVIVIPVYNHERAISAVVHAAQRLDLPLLVVDDGSRDGTAAALQRLAGIVRLRHAHNLGKGAALRTGLHAAERAGADWAIALDGDGQHDPADVPRLLEAIVTAEAHGQRPLIVGCRHAMHAAAAPWTSRFGRTFSNFWVRAAGGPRLSDTQSGLRAYPLPETLQLGIQAGHYQFELEVLVRAARRGLPIYEVPVSVTYHPPGGRVSHFRPWVDFGRNSLLFARLITTRLLTPRRRSGARGAPRSPAPHDGAAA